MLLKYSQAQKRMKLSGTGKPQRATGKLDALKKNELNKGNCGQVSSSWMRGSFKSRAFGMMKLTSTMMNVVPRIHRKVIKSVANKRPNSTHHRIPAASKRQELRPITTVPIDPCDNSNDSGLGFDQHIDYPIPSLAQPLIRLSDQEICYSEGVPSFKRQRIDIKLESDNANDNFVFRRSLPQEQATNLSLCLPARPHVSSPPSLSAQLSSISRDGRVQLQIVCQPEQQHRARYQTEGSRGAVKDRSGNGFPVVKLIGYDKPAVVQVFIGTDQGRVVPHMFYQACRVSGKNSTPCIEKKIDGTVVIEIELLPERDMVITCDCVGILKERNVDVEHRFPEESPGKSKKKSTRCRIVFRTIVVLNDGTTETLQVTSQPIVCTQPPGIPEIGKKSLVACPATGGLELFVFGKNFLKDTKVVFQHDEGDDDCWKAVVQPDKEFLQQSHLVCVIPPYKHQDILNPVTVRLMITSSGKNSEPHDFTYTPPSRYYNLFPVPLPIPQSVSAIPCDDTIRTSTTTLSGINQVHPVMLWPSPLSAKQTSTPPAVTDEEMPPPPPLIALAGRRPSVTLIVPETVVHDELKQEPIEPPQSISVAPEPTTEGVADLSTTHSPSMATLRQFVSETPSLPSISVENYLNRIEVAVENDRVPSFVQKDLGKTQLILDPSQVSTAQLHSASMLRECNSVPDLVQSQIMSDLSQQPTQLHASPIISNQSPVSTLVQTQVMVDVTQQSSKSPMHSPPLMSSCDPSPIKQARYGNSLLSNVSSSIGASSLSSLMISSDSTIQFPQTLESTRNTSHCISEILNSRNASDLQQPTSQSLISESQNVRLSDLVSSTIVQPSTTERLDAFVNCAAESHISTGSSSLPIHLAPVSTNPTQPPINVQTIGPLLQGVQSSCSSTNTVNTSLCSLLTGSPISAIEQPSQTTAQALHPSALASRKEISDLIVSQNISPEILTNSVNMVQPVPVSFSDRSDFASSEMETGMIGNVDGIKSEVKEQFMLMEITSVPSSLHQNTTPTLTSVIATPVPPQDVTTSTIKKGEEGMIPSLGSGIQEITQMSEHDLISYINPSCFDQVE